ncbi:MAG: hypothetical protein ACRET2_02615 [Steroidobacteraceae bacterium]
MATDQNNAPADGAPKSFDDLRDAMLENVQHLLCADRVLYDFDNNEVPPNLQPACTVLHRAAIELDQLEEAFDSWYVHHKHEQRTDLGADAQTEKFRKIVRKLPTDAKERLLRTIPASDPAEVPRALGDYLASLQDRARELQDLLERLDLQDGGEGALNIPARVAHELNEALDSAAIRRVLKSAEDAAS